MEPRDDIEPGADEAIEQLLRAATPAPDQRWLAETERRLLPARGAAPRWRLMLGASAGLAAAVVAVTLAGAGPLATDGGDAARAKPGCEFVYVTEVQPAGELRRGADGTVRVETVQQPVVRQIERCPAP